MRWASRVTGANMPNPDPDDWEAEAARYEARVRELKVGLQMLGVGPDAHLGFCLPGTPFDSVSHVVKLSDTIQNDMVQNGGSGSQMAAALWNHHGS